MHNLDDVINGLEICTTRPCYCTDCPYKKGCCLDSQEVMEDALALLRSRRWTNVRDAMPEKEGFYLVCGGGLIPWIAEMRIYCGVKGFCSSAVSPVVEAWMPLPDPPAAKERSYV